MFIPPDVVPVCSSEEGVCHHTINILTNSHWNIAQQPGMSRGGREGEREGGRKGEMAEA